MSDSANSSKRYCIIMPEDLYEKVHDVAKAQVTTIRGILMRFVRLGLFIEAQLKDDPDTEIVIRKSDGSETVVKIV